MSCSYYNFIKWKNHRLQRPKVLTEQEKISLFFFFLFFVFVALYFTVSGEPSINTIESSNDFVIWMTSFIFSLKMNKVNPFPAPFLPIFLSNLYLAFEAKWLTIRVRYLSLKESRGLLLLFYPNYLLQIGNLKVQNLICN